MKVHNVGIAFTSRVTDREQPGGDRVIKNRFSGRLAEGADGLYLIYSDAADEADYMIKIGEDEALIRRRGRSPLRQPLMLGIPARGSCQLLPGILETEAVAEKIKASWDAIVGSGTATLIYEMKLQGRHAGRFRIDYVYSKQAKRGLKVFLEGQT